jgi:hypothetical protein
MAEMSDERLNEIEARLAAFTQAKRALDGHWCREEPCLVEHLHEAQAFAHGELRGHAPTDIADLLAEVRRLRPSPTVAGRS